MEDKVGIDSSATVTSLDYFLKHASGAYRNHSHDGTSDDGSATISPTTITATTINAFTLGGKITAGASEIEGSNFDINGGTIDGITDLAIVDGGTGASTASAAIANLGILQAVYPVGSIYISTVSTNPATLFSFGTWTAFSEGRVLVGKASSGTFVTAGATGGTETHTLTTAEIPAHVHTITGGTGAGGSTYTTNAGQATDNPKDTTSTGGGGTHNNLQPYVVVYIWQRTV